MSAAEGVICVDLRGVGFINTKEKKGSNKAGVQSRELRGGEIEKVKTFATFPYSNP
jgi:hypothetical protein